jgi:beta-galactosidase
MSTHLRHPPFTFKVGKFEPGSLEAVGYIGGRAVAHNRVVTPEAVDRIQIEFDTVGVCTDAERSDQIFVRARLLDANGTTVPVSRREVEFTGGGRFSVIGPSKLLTEAGIATAFFKVEPGAGPAGVSITIGAQRAGADFSETACRQVFPSRH